MTWTDIVDDSIEVIVLICSAAVMLARPSGVPSWAGPSAGVAALVALGRLGLDQTWTAVSPLRDPLLFLTFAVPLAVSLDRIGLSEAVAARVAGERHLVARRWIMAAVVVIVFNLDAAVVLLTPLYIRIARRNGLSLEALAFQPALLACLASGLLPVSNLTNLIIAEQLDLSIGDFVRNMAAPTLAACTIGYLVYRRAFDFPGNQGAFATEPLRRRPMVLGLPIVALVLLGFTFSDAVGLPVWVVPAVASAWASLACRHVPWRSIPVHAIIVAGGLGVLVAAALPSHGLDRLFARQGTTGDITAFLYGVVASNATNNLPAILAAAPTITDADRTWPLLIGTNIGPVLVLTASLSSLLWQDMARRLGVDISAARNSCRWGCEWASRR